MRGLLASGVFLLPIVVAIGLAGGFVPLLGATDYPWECGQLCRRDFWESATLQDVQAEIDGGADVNAARGLEVYSPLHFAIWQHESPDFIELILASGADPNARAGTRFPSDRRDRNLGRWTPLQLAVEQQHRSPRIIRLLLEYGADPNSWVGDESPLNIASRLWYEGDREIIEMLLDYGADIAVAV